MEIMMKYADSYRNSIKEIPNFMLLLYKRTSHYNVLINVTHNRYSRYIK